MENIFDINTFDNIKSRIGKLSEETQSQWGKMTVGQMMHHCQGPLNIILDKKDYGVKPNWLINILFKKSMYNDKLWKKNLPTLKAFRESQSRDLNQERSQLVELLDELGAQRDREDWQAHPSFGILTKEQWGKMQYKHLDHHLRHFGV
jgi:hypothetical protein